VHESAIGRDRVYKDKPACVDSSENGQFLINEVVSMGRRNTSSKSTCRSLRS
jgi:hypothetical protein